MSVNDASRITIDDSRVTLQIVASLTDNSRGITYDHNVFIEQATGAVNSKKKIKFPFCLKGACEKCNFRTTCVCLTQDADRGMR